jgi:hypothetical protein
MKKGIKLAIGLALIAGCRNNSPVDGPTVTSRVLFQNDLQLDSSQNATLKVALAEINCTDSIFFHKHLVLASGYHSNDTTEIMVIPFAPNGKELNSGAFCSIKDRIILINPVYIKAFALKNTLNDTLSFQPVIELMLLHEIGHFILGKEGAFDNLGSEQSKLGQQVSDSQPEYITSLKKIELSADSLAMQIVRRKLASKKGSCLDVAFDIERVVPGIQFQLAGSRMIDNFGSSAIGFLHDPTNDHPNLELRITFMDYFLFPSDSLKKMIDDYIYNRTVAAVHRQEFDPEIYQGNEKILK